MEDFSIYSGGFTDNGGDEAQTRSLFLLLKTYCLELLELVQNPKKHSSTIPALLDLLRNSPPYALQPFFDYTLFPLLLLLDAAVECRKSQKSVSTAEELLVQHKVSDRVAEGVLQCLEELLKKCHLGSVEQMVVVLKKLTYAALLSPSEAAEEFREGVIKCFRALISNLVSCSNKSCSCKEISGSLMLLDGRDLQGAPTGPSVYHSETGECLLAFLQSEAASAAVGHWLSLLLKAADTEAGRGHRGSANIRIEAFVTLRFLVAKVGTADALAFFLPGVVSHFAKVLHVSKVMISGAAGSVEAIDQAMRALAEYLMIVLHDDANLCGFDMPGDDSSRLSSKKHESATSFLEELRQLPSKSRSQSDTETDHCSGQLVNVVNPKLESQDKRSTNSGKGVGPLHVDRTKEWIEKTSAHLNKLLSSTFPQICVHPAKKIRQGLLASIQGLLSRCTYTLKESRLMFMECLCVLVVDDTEEIAAAAQEFMEYLLSSTRKHHIEDDIAEIFSRLIEKLPKMVLGSDESLALSHAQQLLAVIYYSGPLFLLNRLQSPVMAARFLDIFALCLSQNSAFTGSLDKLLSARPSSTGYLRSVDELKAGLQFVTGYKPPLGAASFIGSKRVNIQENVAQDKKEIVQENYKIPRMPPWFIYVGSQKLYEAIAGVLRLVGLSLMADYRNEGHLSVITDIPLGYLRKLVSEVRAKEYTKESWQSWYNQSSVGQLLRQASNAACILNEMIFGLSEHASNDFKRMFQKSKMKRIDLQECSENSTGGQAHEFRSAMVDDPVWKVSQQKADRNHLINCVGKILHEYLSSEVWNLSIDQRSSHMQLEIEVEDISPHFFRDTAMLHQVIIDGIGIFTLCLGKDFASSGFLHSSLYLLLENLTCSNFDVRRASDAVLHILSGTCGHSTVGELVLANADYVIDSICRQLRHLDLNPHAPNVLASMLSYIGVGHKILPLLEEPMRSVSQELEILGRHKHPDLTIPFLKAIAEIVKASKHEASLLPSQAESHLMDTKSKISDMEKKAESCFDNNMDMSFMEMISDQWETILFKLNDFKRYRQTIASIASSCLTTAIPLLASMNQASCLAALDIVEDGMATLAKVEEAYRHEQETKEAIGEMLESCSLYELKDTLDASEDGNTENRLLPAMNKLWPFLVACVRNRNTVAVRRCVSVVSSVVHVCGGDFFSRRFHTDGSHFWKLLNTSPFQKKPISKEEKTPLQLPYRTSAVSSEESVAEGSNMKLQVATLNMITDLSRNKRSASALEAVFKKVSGLVVGIACSGVIALHDASVNALKGLASIDPDLIWLLLADVYYSLKKKDLPSPPTSDYPEIFDMLPPPSSHKEFLYVQYGGQTYGFDIDFSAVETVFRKLQGI